MLYVVSIFGLYDIPHTTYIVVYKNCSQPLPGDVFFPYDSNPQCSSILVTGEEVIRLRRVKRTRSFLNGSLPVFSHCSFSTLWDRLCCASSVLAMPSVTRK